jgi:hypothetical protein
VGCYTDTQPRALPVQLGGINETIQSCRALAASYGYTYAGLQYYGYCFAGNVLGYTQVADSECNTPCTADSTSMCGGAWRNSIYKSRSGCQSFSPPSTREPPNLYVSP